MINFDPEPIIMKIRRHASRLLFFFLFTPLFLQAQTLHSFLEDDTLVRKLHLNESLRKREETINQIGKDYAEDYKRIYKDQYTEIEKFWSSSRPITEKKAMDYLLRLVDKLMAADPELKKLDLRVVFSRDWWPNAVSMGDGTLSLNAGLIIYMQSEAELVFVLGHEIAHYYYNHTSQAIKRFVEKVNSEAFKAEIKRLKNEQYRKNQQLEQLTKQLTFDTRRHSRDKESQADAYALALMTRAGYDPLAARNTLLLLDRVDDTLVFDPAKAGIEQVFHFADYPFKKRWIQKESMLFGDLREEEEGAGTPDADSLKTHPDCQIRIGQLEAALTRDGGKGKQYLVDSVYFHQLQDDLYYEIMEGCFREKLYSRNLYYALLLLGREPENPTAIISIARAWNEIYRLQKEHRLGTTVETEDKSFPPSYNLLLRMIGRIKLEEILAMNTAFCKKYYEIMKAIPEYKTEIKRLYEFKNN